MLFIRPALVLVVIEIGNALAILLGSHFAVGVQYIVHCCPAAFFKVHLMRFKRLVGLGIVK